jgi:nucleoside-diphosphate-sugar epimerase
MIRVLIVGAGDVARRLMPLIANRFRVFVLLRSAEKAPAWRAAGACPIAGDLDDRRSLARAAALAQWVVHLAPPPASGGGDPRTGALLAALRRPRSLAQRLVYISTSGVYGDCSGALVSEARTPSPTTPRARRRLAAERLVRRFAKSRRACILRVPGIYAADRLPLPRLHAGTPALRAEEDVFTNHIHADDLAIAIRSALFLGRSGRVYHVVDDSAQKMGDYFDAVADAFRLPRPPRVSREEAKRWVDPGLLSFMSESRRLDNRRMKRELRVRLRYPDTAAGLAAAIDSECSPC